MILKHRKFAPVAALLVATMIGGQSGFCANAGNAADADNNQPAAVEQNSAEQTPPGASSQTLSAKVSENTLKGSVVKDGSATPFLTGSVQALPKGTQVDFTALVNINSEISQKGDEVWMQVSQDVKGANGVAVPGGWYAHGIVTEAKPQRRLGLDGYVDIQFDKMVAPDKVTEVPFDAKISTKDSLMKTVARHVAIDSGHVALGALGGSILSVQVTGIPGAIATHGISVGVGAGVGATIGAIGAAKRKGRIASVYPGDVLKLVAAEPIVLPGFNAAALPSAKPPSVIKDLDMRVSYAKFDKDPQGCTSSKLLRLDVIMNNKTKDSYTLTDLRVVSDHNQLYPPSMANIAALTKMKIEPNHATKVEVDFPVDGNRHKYWLVLVDKASQEQFNRVPIN